MGLQFEELDGVTREFMLDEFDREQESANPFVGADLSRAGQGAFPGLVRDALEQGDDDTLIATFHHAGLWESHQSYRLKDGTNGRRKINVGQRARLLGLSEFNTWYVRGLAARLWDESVEFAQIYRAGDPMWSPSRDCMDQEGQVVSVELVHSGHRARYWPTRDSAAFSVPVVPNCHHTIRRA